MSKAYTYYIIWKFDLRLWIYPSVGKEQTLLRNNLPLHDLSSKAVNFQAQGVKKMLKKRKTSLGKQNYSYNEIILRPRFDS